MDLRQQGLSDRQSREEGQDQKQEPDDQESLDQAQHQAQHMIRSPDQR